MEQTQHDSETSSTGWRCCPSNETILSAPFLPVATVAEESADVVQSPQARSKAGSVRVVGQAVALPEGSPGECQCQCKQQKLHLWIWLLLNHGSQYATLASSYALLWN